MSIEIKISIPDDEIGQGAQALERRMAVLGYAFGHAAVPVIGGDAAPAMSLGEAMRAEQAAEQPKEEPKKGRGRPKKDDKPQITAQPESRAEPEPDPEVEAQDEADEQAEVAAHGDPAKVLTIDDFRAAASLYIAKFGMDAAQADGPAILRNALGAPPENHPFWKMTLIAETGQEALRKAVDAWSAAAAEAERFSNG